MNIETVSFVPDKYYYYYDNTLSISKNKSIDNVLKCFLHANKNMQIVIDTAIRFGIEKEKLFILMNKQRNIIIPAIHDKLTFKYITYKGSYSVKMKEQMYFMN